MKLALAFALALAMHAASAQPLQVLATYQGADREQRLLEGARKEFSDLLRKLQTNEDFIDELLQIREHQRAIDVIHTLTGGIRDASEKLKNLLGAIRTPGA